MTARRWLLRLGVVLLALVALNAAWLGVRVLRTRSHLLAAQRHVAAARADIAAGHIDDALAEAARAAAATRAARGTDGDPVWSLDSHLPGIGPSLQAISALATAADGLATDVVPALTRVADDVRGDHLRLPGGGGIDLARLSDAAPRVDAAVTTLAATRARVAAIDPAGLAGPVAGARTTLLGQLDGLAAQLAGAQKALRLAPAMLGADGPRTYFLVFENTAEARGTGGILGEFGVLTVDHGRVDLTRTGANEQLLDVATPAAMLAPDAVAQWGPLGQTTEWRNTTVSPHYPDTAAAIEGLWRRRTGQRLDGVVTVDPTAIGYLLAAAPPVVLADGTTVPGASFASFVESGLYVRYPDNAARKAVLQQVEKAVFADLLHAGADPGGLITGLGRAAGERRLLVASTRPDEEAQLAETAAGGDFPDAAGPFSGLVVNNASSDKLDYYLGRDLDVRAGACAPDGTRSLTTTATLRNDAPDPATLPSYVSGRDNRLHTVGDGVLKEYVTLYGGVGATLESVTLDGLPAVTIPGVDRGHPVANLFVTIPPRGGARTLRIVWRERAGAVQPPYVQPLVQEPRLTVEAPPCG